MNTRGQVHGSFPAQSNKGEVDEFIGIKFKGKDEFAKVKQLRRRETKSTKWACAANLNHLGIGNDFNMAVTNVGL
jgi:hypothetical protein